MICIKMYCYITVQKADCWEIPFCQTAAKFVILEVVFIWEPWAYFVTYNRGKLEMLKNTPLYERISKIDEGKDVIIGPIADDSMREAMRRFTENELTDIAFLKCISSLNLGNQYVAKTPFACSKIKILSSRELVAGELQTALELSNQIYRDGSKLTRQFMAQYRRQGKYLDEIVAEEQERIQHETIMEKSNNEYDY